jgi:hypothetical protein
MSLKKFFIPFIILIIVILVLEGVLLFLTQKQKEPAPPAPVEERPKPPAPVEEKPKEVKKPEIKEFDDSFLKTKQKSVKPTEEEREKAALNLQVRNFVETFGSFSTSSGYVYIENLYSQMTDEFRKQTEGWVKTNPARQKSLKYYSILTEVSEVKIEELTEMNSRLRADTMRTETLVPEFYNQRQRQSAVVELVKVNGEWKVDKVEWR